MSASTIKSYKKGVWEVFSLYIRARDADKNGIVRCCTCNKQVFWKGVECQAGHFVPGRTNSVLFDERIVHGQCSRCNEYLGGNLWEYGRFMIRTYGFDYEQLDKLNALKNVVKQFKLDELKEMKKLYKAKLEILIQEKGLNA